MGRAASSISMFCAPAAAPTLKRYLAPGRLSVAAPASRRDTRPRSGLCPSVDSAMRPPGYVRDQPRLGSPAPAPGFVSSSWAVLARRPLGGPSPMSHFDPLRPAALDFRRRSFLHLVRTVANIVFPSAIAPICLPSGPSGTSINGNGILSSFRHSVTAPAHIVADELLT
ncbi:hypothetical protein C8Q77DRAFT_572817 [Trametes polyzona]|nr:hypothetical protein C8Q77DRAFT_572817 [Trametes polyzona]